MVLYLIFQNERKLLQAAKESLTAQVEHLQASITEARAQASAAVALEEDLRMARSALKLKNEEVASERQRAQALQEQGELKVAQGKALQENLARLAQALSEREGAAHIKGGPRAPRKCC